MSDPRFSMGPDGSLTYQAPEGATTVRTVKGAAGPVAVDVPGLGKNLLLIQAAITPASVAAGASSAVEQTIAFAGLLTTDVLVALLPPAAPTAGVQAGPARIPSNGNIAVQYVNPTAGALTPAAGTYTAVVLR